MIFCYFWFTSRHVFVNHCQTSDASRRPLSLQFVRVRCVGSRFLLYGKPWRTMARTKQTASISTGGAKSRKSMAAEVAKVAVLVPRMASVPRTSLSVHKYGFHYLSDRRQTPTGMNTRFYGRGQALRARIRRRGSQ